MDDERKEIFVSHIFLNGVLTLLTIQQSVSKIHYSVEKGKLTVNLLVARDTFCWIMMNTKNIKLFIFFQT